MKERSILFSAPMVQAILDGRKTQTRRVVKPQPVASFGFEHIVLVPDVFHADAFRGTPAEGIGRQGKRELRWYLEDHAGNLVAEWDVHCPYGSPWERDRLWVRETWAPADRMYENHECSPPKAVAYRADHSAISWHKDPPQSVPEWDLASWDWDHLRWRPSIHLPRWASRITLEVTEVRVQRVQEISEGDAEAEGDPKRGLIASENTHVEWFRSLWDSINGRRPGCAWSDNPWCWCLSFRRVNETEEIP